MRRDPTTPRRLWRLISVATILATASTALPAAPAWGAHVPNPAADDDPMWDRFVDDRIDYLHRLAAPIMLCFQNKDVYGDSASPMFDGCVNWHSAVQAGYAHHVLYRLTGVQGFRDLVEGILSKSIKMKSEVAPAELAYMRTSGKAREHPYGFGWLLSLAQEREVATERTDLRLLADYAAGELEAFVTGSGPAVPGLPTREECIESRSYCNLSWALIQLDTWGRHAKDSRILRQVRGASQLLLDPALDETCPLTEDLAPPFGSDPGLMPACMMRVAAVAHIWGQHASDWVRARLPEQGSLATPVKKVVLDEATAPVPNDDNGAGSNFYRAFALWQLFSVTHDARLRDAYVELIRYHMGRPDLWRDKYLWYSHWVPQIGVRAIAASIQDPPSTPNVEPPPELTVADAPPPPAAAGGTGEPATAPQDPWQRFLDDRVDYLYRLGPPVVACFKNVASLDPASPMFHGCVDWHSAVHSSYSHHALSHWTGDPAFVKLWELEAKPEALVPAELAYMQVKGQPAPIVGEIPYGFAWFLALAREREVATGKLDLRPLATYVALKLKTYFDVCAVGACLMGLSGSYTDFSWALIQLDLWGRYTQDQTILQTTRTATERLVDPSVNCPIYSRGDFIPPCVMRLAAVAHVWGAASGDWIRSQLPEGGLSFPPMESFGSGHESGQNFYAAFALWYIYLATGNERIRDNYVDVLRFTMNRPQIWACCGSILGYHWVAQVGVRAISASFEDPPTTPDVEPPPELVGAGSTGGRE